MLRILLTAALAVASVNAQTKVCSKKPSSSLYAPAPAVSTTSPDYFGALPHSSSPLSSTPAHVGGSPHSSGPSLGGLAPSSSPVSSGSPKVSGSPHSSGPSLGGFPPSSVGTKPSSSSPHLSASPSSSGCVNSPSNRQCWGQYDINTDYYTTTPQGKIVEYFLTVDNVTMAPDGVEKEMYVYNGQFPGPLIEANWGDTLVIHVQNNLQYNGTSIHWHGLLMAHNVANDGVPGVTQCPIPPGGSFTYTFQATSYGHTWYHSHFSLQYSNGLTGPIIIYGPSSANWDIDLGVLPIMDWYHESAFTAYYQERHAPLAADNALFNGLNTFDDGGNTVGSKYQMTFQPGKKHRIRLVNMSTDSHFKFSIDEHTLTVMAADFVPIEPYTTEVLNIFIGQRYDLVVEADQAVDNYWMRLIATAGCSNVVNTDLTAIVSYVGAASGDPTSTAYVPADQICEDETGLVPVVVRDVQPFSYGSGMDITIDQKTLVDDNLFQWDINGSSFVIDWEDPTLLLVDDNEPFPLTYNVLELNGTEATWVYFVVQSNGLFAINHPIHMHGHDFLLLASGSGPYDNSVLATIDFTNPPRRDVATLPASGPGDPVGGYIVIGFPLDNPGIWMIHCHIAWHVSEGLAMQFIERPPDIPGNVGVTSQWTDNCEAWKTYQDTVKPLQDDSGI